MFVAHSEIAVLWGKRSLKKARSGCGSRGISTKGDWMESHTTACRGVGQFLFGSR